MTKEEIKKETWLEFVWPGYHWYQGINPAYAYMEDIPNLGYKFSKFAVGYSRGTESFYYIKDEFENNGAKFFEEVKKHPDLLNKILATTNNAAEEIFKIGKKWQNLDFTKLSDRELLTHHKELFKWDKPLWRNGQVPNLLELHNSYLTEYVQKVIKETFPEMDSNEVFSILTTSTYESVGEQQDRDFLELLGKAKNKKFDELLIEHWKKYTWMTYGWAGPALSLDYFRDGFERAAKDKTAGEKIRESGKQKSRILSEQSRLLSRIPASDRKLVVLLRSLLEQKAKRVDAHSLTYFLAEQMMAEIGKRVGLTMDLMRMVPPDGMALLFKSVNRERLEVEYNHVMLWLDEGVLRKLVGPEAGEKLKYIQDRLPKVEVTDEIKGQLAYRGNVKGKVRVIFDIKDSGKLQPGEILVTRMTDPSYVPIMKIAGAIITDVGGITCHAAIVSRELKIPCIVGTKIATKVLKDGDEIEVDANQGIVRILNK